MWHRAADLRTLLLWPLLAVGSGLLLSQTFNAIDWLWDSVAPTPSVIVNVAQDGGRLELITKAAAFEPAVSVYPLRNSGSSQPLLGTASCQSDRVVFQPALPFLAEQKYEARWRDRHEREQRVTFEIHAAKSATPTVMMLPQAVLPSNALKLYLQFTEPMEQGVFLERLSLHDNADKIVTGPFRETELWSPDGTRLTVWFHPGRQKTGVNLNLDEGPVLRPGQHYTLVVAGTWRSAKGLALGADVRLPFETGPTDSVCPSLERWKIIPPITGSNEFLHINFDEPLDTAMLQTALSIWRDGKALPIHTDVPISGQSWSATLSSEWQPGAYELRCNPDLEDLAGNSLARPFEVNEEGPPHDYHPQTIRQFEVR